MLRALGKVVIQALWLLLLPQALAATPEAYAKAAHQQLSKGDLFSARVLAVEAVEAAKQSLPPCGVASGTGLFTYTVFPKDEALRLFRVRDGAIEYYDLRNHAVKQLWRAALADDARSARHKLRPSNPVARQFSNRSTRNLDVLNNCGTQPRIDSEMVEFVYVAPPGSVSAGYLSASGQYLERKSLNFIQRTCPTYGQLRVNHCNELLKFGR